MSDRQIIIDMVRFTPSSTVKQIGEEPAGCIPAGPKSPLTTGIYVYFRQDPI